MARLNWEKNKLKDKIRQRDIELREKALQKAGISSYSLAKPLGKYKMGFGKHKNKFYEEIAKKDLQYLIWCAETLDLKFVKNIVKYLKQYHKINIVRSHAD